MSFKKIRMMSFDIENIQSEKNNKLIFTLRELINYREVIISSLQCEAFLNKYVSFFNVFLNDRIWQQCIHTDHRDISLLHEYYQYVSSEHRLAAYPHLSH